MVKKNKAVKHESHLAGGTEFAIHVGKTVSSALPEIQIEAHWPENVSGTASGNELTFSR